MNKLELIQIMCTTNGLLKREATEIVNLFFDQRNAAMSTMNHASFGIWRRVRCLLAG